MFFFFFYFSYKKNKNILRTSKKEIQDFGSVKYFSIKKFVLSMPLSIPNVYFSKLSPPSFIHSLVLYVQLTGKAFDIQIFVRAKR